MDVAKNIRIYSLKNPEDIERLIADIPEIVLPVYIYQNPDRNEIILVSDKPVKDEELDSKFTPAIDDDDIIDPNNPDDEIIFDDYDDDDILMMS